jgi:hypothetical protein
MHRRQYPMHNVAQRVSSELQLDMQLCIKRNPGIREKYCLWRQGGMRACHSTIAVHYMNEESDARPLEPGRHTTRNFAAGPRSTQK